MHFCCSHYISPCFLSTSPLSFSLSLLLSLSLSFSLSLFISAPSFSLWLQDTCHLMPFTKYSLLDQSYFFTPYLSIAHITFTNYSPTIFYDYHPQSCLKKHLFRSRANRRLVLFKCVEMSEWLVAGKFFFGSWFVVWNIWIIFPIILEMSSSQLTLSPSFFRGVGQPPTRIEHGHRNS